jgi:DNA sulfur modification protein DndD
MGQKGYLAFTGELAERCLATVSSLHEKGELPAPLKKQFVDELLERGVCICNRDLADGGDPYLAVCGWRERAGAGAEEAWGQLTAHAKHARDERPAFYSDLRERVQHLFSLGAAEKKLKERLSELHKQLSDKDSATIKSLEERRQKVKDDIDSLGLKLGGVRQEMKALQEVIKSKEKQLKEAEEKGERAQKAKRRVEIATAARDIFERILALRTEEVRSGLDERVRRIFSDISFKASVPRLSGDFHLELLESIDGGHVVAKSTGENLLLSLSFVGALAEYARERFEESSRKSGELAAGLSYRGGIYPLVTDSPFGDLDENYCSDIARAIPVLAPQVVVMISKRQAGGPVESELGQRVGARYVLEFHTEKEQTAETINVLGHEYPYISHADGTLEWAEIRTIG